MRMEAGGYGFCQDRGDASFIDKCITHIEDCAYTVLAVSIHGHSITQTSKVTIVAIDRVLYGD